MDGVLHWSCEIRCFAWRIDLFQIKKSVQHWLMYEYIGYIVCILYIYIYVLYEVLSQRAPHTNQQKKPLIKVKED